MLGPAASERRPKMPDAIRLRSLSLLAVLLVSGCSLGGLADNSTTPTPSQTTTRVETGAEKRTREDFASAEATYRASVAEQNSLYAIGGASKATTEIRRTASGSYLELIVTSLRTLKTNGWYAKGEPKISKLSPTLWRENAVTLVACEDASAVKLIDKSGKDVTPAGDRLFVQTLQVLRSDGIWRVDGIKTLQVTSFDNQAGC